MATPEQIARERLGDDDSPFHEAHLALYAAVIRHDRALRSSSEDADPISAEVLTEVERELVRYRENAVDGDTTVVDAASDVVQRLHDLYGVMPIPQDAERTWFTCVDCDSGDMVEDAARWHASHEGHVVEEIGSEEEVD